MAGLGDLIQRRKEREDEINIGNELERVRWLQLSQEERQKELEERLLRLTSPESSEPKKAETPRAQTPTTTVEPPAPEQEPIIKQQPVDPERPAQEPIKVEPPPVQDKPEAPKIETTKDRMKRKGIPEITGTGTASSMLRILTEPGLLREAGDHAGLGFRGRLTRFTGAFLDLGITQIGRAARETTVGALNARTDLRDPEASEINAAELSEEVAENAVLFARHTLERPVRKLVTEWQVIGDILGSKAEDTAGGRDVTEEEWADIMDRRGFKIGNKDYKSYSLDMKTCLDGAGYKTTDSEGDLVLACHLQAVSSGIIDAALVGRVLKNAAMTVEFALTPTPQEVGIVREFTGSPDNVKQALVNTEGFQRQAEQLGNTSFADGVTHARQTLTDVNIHPSWRTTPVPTAIKNAARGLNQPTSLSLKPAWQQLTSPAPGTTPSTATLSHELTVSSDTAAQQELKSALPQPRDPKTGQFIPRDTTIHISAEEHARQQGFVITSKQGQLFPAPGQKGELGVTLPEQVTTIPIPDGGRQVFFKGPRGETITEIYNSAGRLVFRESTLTVTKGLPGPVPAGGDITSFESIPTTVPGGEGAIAAVGGAGAELAVVQPSVPGRPTTPGEPTFPATPAVIELPESVIPPPITPEIVPKLQDSSIAQEVIGAARGVSGSSGTEIMAAVSSIPDGRTFVRALDSVVKGQEIKIRELTKGKDSGKFVLEADGKRVGDPIASLDRAVGIRDAAEAIRLTGAENVEDIARFSVEDPLSIVDRRLEASLQSAIDSPELADFMFSRFAGLSIANATKSIPTFIKELEAVSKALVAKGKSGFIPQIPVLRAMERAGFSTVKQFYDVATGTRRMEGIMQRGTAAVAEQQAAQQSLFKSGQDDIVSGKAFAPEPKEPAKLTPEDAIAKAEAQRKNTRDLAPIDNARSLEEWRKWRDAELIKSDNSPLRTSDYTIMTAENPLNTGIAPKDNAIRNKRLVDELKAAGYRPIKAPGKYENFENSYIIPGMTEGEALIAALRHGQESVATPHGLIYTNGTRDVPELREDGLIDVKFDKTLDDFYTDIFIKGEQIRFQLQYGKNQPLEAGAFQEPAPPAAEAPRAPTPGRLLGETPLRSHVLTDSQVIKIKLGAESRAARLAYRKGYRDSHQENMASLQAGRAADKIVRDNAREYVKRLPPKERAQFLTRIDKVRALQSGEASKELGRIYEAVNKRANEIEVNQLIGLYNTALKRATNSRAVDTDIKEQLREMGNEYVAKGPSPKFKAKLEEARKQLNEQIAAGVDVTVSEKLIEQMELLNRKPLNEMTPDEIDHIVGEIERLEAIGRNRVMNREAMRKAEFDRDIAKLEEADIPGYWSRDTSIPTNRIISGEPLTRYESMLRKYRDMRNRAEAANRALNPRDTNYALWDGGTYDGVHRHVFANPIDIATGNFLNAKFDVRDEMLELARPLMSDKWWDGTISTDRAFAMKKRRLGLAADAQQADGRKRLEALGLSQKEIADIRAGKNLSPEEKKVLEWWHGKDGQGGKRAAILPLLKEYMRLEHNVELEGIEGYFPATRNLDATGELTALRRMVHAPGFDENFVKFPVNEAVGPERVDASFIHRREGGLKDINIDFFRVVEDYLVTWEHLKHMGPTLNRLIRVAESDTYRDTAGDAAQIAMIDDLDMMMRMGGVAGDNVIKVLDGVRRNTSVGVMGFRIPTTLLQPSAMHNAAAYIGRDAYHGMIRFLNDKKAREFAFADPEIRARMGDDRSILDLEEVGTFRRTLAKGGMWAMVNLDKGTAAGAGYTGALINWHRTRGLTLDLDNVPMEAILYARRITAQSQASFLANRAPAAITRGGFTKGLTGKPSSSVDRAVFQFGGFGMFEWSTWRNDFWRMGVAQGDWKKASRMLPALVIAAVNVVGARMLYDKALDWALGNEDEDDRDIYERLVREFLGKHPVFGDVFTGIEYDSIFLGPVDVTQTAFRGVSQMLHGSSPESKIRGAVQVAGSAGTLGGFGGSSQFEKILNDFLKISEEQERERNRGVGGSGNSRIDALHRNFKDRQDSRRPDINSFNR